MSHRIARDHGFWDNEERLLAKLEGEDRSVFLNNLVAAKLMLLTSEASETNDCVRAGDVVSGVTEYRGPTGKPEGIASELADIVIRAADLAKWLGIDLGLAIQTKTNYNKSRPYKHGKTI